MLRNKRVRRSVIAGAVAVLAAVGGLVVFNGVAQAATTWRQVDAGGQHHVCAIKTDGSLWCWGANDDGQLGLGDTTNRTRPTRVGTAKNWVKVSVSMDRSCALNANTEIYCWGFDPFSDGAITTPKRQKGSGYSDLAVGSDHTCAIQGGSTSARYGPLYCWGRNYAGQLGLGDTKDRRDPTKVTNWGEWTTVTASTSVTCGLRGKVRYCWGSNYMGRLGLGDTTDRTRPVEETNYQYQYLRTGPGATTCGITPQQRLLCWGSNEFGRVGVGHITEPYYTRPQLVTTRSWSVVNTGFWHTCGVQTDGRGYCWGGNYWGSLGRADVGSAHQPMEVTGDHRWSTISAGWHFSCGIRTDGQLYCWGYNGSGQLGIGTTASRATPAPVLT